jgi:HlyD family secretion protein
LAIGAGGWIAYSLGVADLLVGKARPPGEAPAEGAAATQAADDERRSVGALGRFVPADGIIDVGALAGERLVKIAVREGDVVQPGQPLAYLESRALRQIELEALSARIVEAEARRGAEERLADARIAAAAAGVKQAEAQQLDIDAQREKIVLAEANLAVATKDAERLAGLSKELATDRERQHQDLLVRQAKAELSAAGSLLKKLTQSRELAIAAATADLAAAQATKGQVLSAIPIESLKKDRQLVQAQLDRTVIAAPCRGTVLKVFAHPGELVAPQPILQLADLENVGVVAEVYETDLKRIAVGQQVRVASRALPAPHDRDGLRGRVTRIGRMIAPPDMRSLDPTAAVDRRVVEVRVELDAAGSRVAASLVHLQVDVTFTAAKR